MTGSNEDPLKNDLISELVVIVGVQITGQDLEQSDLQNNISNLLIPKYKKYNF